MIEIDGQYYKDIMADYYDYLIYDKPREAIKELSNAVIEILEPIVRPVLDRLLKVFKLLRIEG